MHRVEGGTKFEYTELRGGQNFSARPKPQNTSPPPPINNDRSLKTVYDPNIMFREGLLFIKGEGYRNHKPICKTFDMLIFIVNAKCSSTLFTEFENTR